MHDLRMAEEVKEQEELFKKRDVEDDILEAAEQQILLERGFEFTLDGKKFKVQQPVLAQLDKLAEQFLKLDIDKAIIQPESGDIDAMKLFEEQKRIVSPNIKICAKIIAISVVDHKTKGGKTTWLTNIKEWYLINKYYKRFLRLITPDDLYRITNVILRAMNLAPFTNSIALMSIPTIRTTAPKAMEEGKQNL